MTLDIPGTLGNLRDEIAIYERNSVKYRRRKLALNPTKTSISTSELTKVDDVRDPASTVRGLL